MVRFACTAYKKHHFITPQQFGRAITEQWRQESHSPEGFAQHIGQILVDQGVITEEQRSAILNDLILEPNISWERDTAFARSLSINKNAKQIISDYVGRKLVGYSNDTIFLAGASTIYYAFLGLIKHNATVSIRTINAAILAAYPSMQSSLDDVISIWEGSVDVNYGIINPAEHLHTPDSITQHAGFTPGRISCALMSVTGFNCFSGPLGNNEIARMIARQALISQTPVWILMDHTKILMNKSRKQLLFPDTIEWQAIRDKGNIELIVNCHPDMPSEQANLDITSREVVEIKNIMRANEQSEEDINSVVQYHEWTMRVRDMIDEVPYR